MEGVESLKILFVHQGLKSFVKKDLDILRSSHEVRSIQFTGREGLLKNFIPALWKLWHGVLWCDITFSWFGALHAFFAVFFSRMLKRRSIVVAGGWDVGQWPDGLVFQRYKGWCPQYVFSRADLVLSVSDFNHSEAISNIRAKMNHIQRIYHGFDAERYRTSKSMHREKIVITVGTVCNYYLERKGLFLFVKAASYLPDTQFCLIGQWLDETIDTLKSIASSNVRFLGMVTDEELIEWYSRAQVYVQASRHEAFGCSVAEAMLCGCIPVVSKKSALPEVVGDCGYYIDRLDPESLAEKIGEALQAPAEMGEHARQRIIDHFPLEKRSKELLAAVASLRK